MKFTNSPLVNHTRISPNRTNNRKNEICRITIHHIVGQCSVESLGNMFAPTSRQASSNYGIGFDGRIGMYCEEKDRSWCSSSSDNDNKAVTIECADDAFYPYKVNDVAYESLIKLCADICERNGKTKLIWIEDKNKALTYKLASNEMLLTVHRWFAATACPGDWLYERMGEIASKVTAELGAMCVMPKEEIKLPYLVKVSIKDLFIRKGPGTNYNSVGFIKPGAYTIVEEANGKGATKWGKLKSGAGWISLDFVSKL